MLIFWLCTFALDADRVSEVVQYENLVGDYDTSSSGSNQYCYDGVCVSYMSKRGLVKRDTGPVAATLYTALALSVINL